MDALLASQKHLTSNLRTLINSECCCWGALVGCGYFLVGYLPQICPSAQPPLFGFGLSQLPTQADPWCQNWWVHSQHTAWGQQLPSCASVHMRSCCLVLPYTHNIDRPGHHPAAVHTPLQQQPGRPRKQLCQQGQIPGQQTKPGGSTPGTHPGAVVGRCGAPQQRACRRIAGSCCTVMGCTEECQHRTSSDAVLVISQQSPGRCPLHACPYRSTCSSRKQSSA